MNEQERIHLEGSIQDLQAGELSPGEITELLARIAIDDEARRAIKELIELQNLSRRSFGCDVANEAMNANVSDTLDAVRAMDAAGANGKSPTGGRAGLANENPS